MSSAISGAGRFVELPAPARTTVAIPVPRASWIVRTHRLVPPYLYLTPAVVLLVIWVYRPLAQTFQLSFSSWNLLPTSPLVPVGTQNYRDLLTQPALGDSVLNTAELIAGLLPFTLLLPVLAGVVGQRVGGRARAVYQTLIFAPMLVAPVAGAATWLWLLDPRGGAVDRVLGTDVNWLQESGPAQVAIIVITGWHLLGFAVLVVVAGLAGIHPDYHEAAQLDGASRRQVLGWITLPLLSPTLVFLLLMTILLAGQWTFPLIDSLTQGGPAGATTNVFYLLWEYGFRSYDAGRGAAAGVLFFLGFGVIAVGLVALLERLSFHDD